MSRQRRTNSARWVSLEQVAETGAQDDVELEARQHDALNRLMILVRQLEPLGRRVILSCLEGLDAASIGEITGFSPRNVATRIHRVKPILARRFQEGGSHGE